MIAAYDGLVRCVEGRPYLAELKPSIDKLGISILTLSGLVRRRHQIHSVGELERMLGIG